MALACQLRAADPGPAPTPFSGTAVDGQGRPVAGADVDCYQYSSAMALFLPGKETLEHTTTDSQGAFTFPVTEEGGIVVVKKTGLATAWKTRLFGQGGSTDPLVLSAPSTLTGRVVDQNGKPVEGAGVWVSVAMDQEEAGIVTQPNILFGKAARDSFSAQSAADGRFRLENLPANAHVSLSLAKPGLALRGGEGDLTAAFGNGLPYQPGKEEVKLVVEPAATIQGTLTIQETGQGLADVKLRLQPATQGFALGGLNSAEPIQSGANGEFSFSDVAAGSYKVMAEFEGKPMPDWVAQSDTVTVASGETARDAQVRASKGGVLMVAVVSKTDQKPVPNMNVLAINPLDQNQSSAFTDTNGVALLRLVPGQCIFIAVKKGWSQQQEDATVQDAQTNRVQIEAAPPLSIKGTVRGPSSEPIAGARLSVGPNYGDQTEFTTDANGHYELTWAMQNYGQNASYYITARSLEKKLAVTRGIDEATTNLDLQLQPALAISAKVEDAKGKPISNATAILMLSSGNTGLQLRLQPAQADAQGRIRFEALPPGQKYSISVSAKGYGSASQQVEETATQTASYQFPAIVLPLANRKLGGQVLGADGKPAASVMVQLNGEGQPNAVARTDATGRFHFDAVCDGLVNLFANAQGAFANAQASGGDTNIVLRLQNNRQVMAGAQSAIKITGIVTDSSGAPVAGARLALYPNWWGNAEARTDANGRYSLNVQNMQMIRQQNMTPMILARSLERNLAIVHDIDAQTTNLDLRLEEGMTISAKVQDADGLPIKSAMAALIYITANNGFQLDGDMARADDQGRIRIQAAPQGHQYSVNITASGYGSADQMLMPADTKTASFECQTFVLRLADRKLAGQVLGLDGKPVSGAQVNINGQGQPNGNTRSDANGHFSFTVCEGPVSVFAYRQPSGPGQFLQANVQVYGGDTNVVVRLGNNMRQAGGGEPSPFKPVPWTWAAISQWPRQYPKVAIVLLSVQVAALLATAGGIFWITRNRGV
jgi:hypothetical protein